jgi:hypothetical protein
LQTSRGIPIDITVAANCFKKPVQAARMAWMASAVVPSAAEALTQTFTMLFSIIEERRCFLNRMDFMIMRAAWKMAEGLAKTRFTRQNIIACRLKMEMQPQRTVLASAYSEASALTTVYPSPLTSIGDPPNRAMQTAQIILGFASSAPAVFSKALKWRPIISSDTLSSKSNLIALTQNSEKWLNQVLRKTERRGIPRLRKLDEIARGMVHHGGSAANYTVGIYASVISKKLTLEDLSLHHLLHSFCTFLCSISNFRIGT